MRPSLKHVHLMMLGSLLVSSPLVAHAQTIPSSPTDDSFTEMFTKGSFNGTASLMNFSTHNAYFARGLNQDTTAYGANVNFYSAPYKGFTFGVGGYIQRGIDRNDNHLITELGNNQNNIGEAWLRWQGAGFTITGGNQQLSIPFATTWNWRVTPNLFQGIDLKYGTSENYIEATRVYRYKWWGAGRFSKTNMYNLDGTVPADRTTSGMWSIGAHGTYDWSNITWTGDAWHEAYHDFDNIDYFQGKGELDGDGIRPFAAVQFIHGYGNGKTLTANGTNGSKDAQSHIYGVQAGFDYKTFNLSLNYDHTTLHRNGYLDGALVTPYAHNAASGPIFAQPFFTSTQDLGAGNAYLISASNVFNNVINHGQLIAGLQYSFMDQAGYPTGYDNGRYTGKSLNQSEYLAYFIYDFGGALSHLSLQDWAGVQVAHRPDTHHDTFWQNRVVLQYSF